MIASKEKIIITGGGFIGICTAQLAEFSCAIDLDAIMLREITVKTTCGVTDPGWKDALGLILFSTLKIGPLITHRFSSGDILAGCELLDEAKPFNLSVVFNRERHDA